MRCDSMNYELLNAYVQALRPERERYLYQHALNKVRVITRSMKPAEKEAYLQSEAFLNTLRQLQRRDRIWQGLLRGELVLVGDQAEYERLAGLIATELHDGHKIDLAFLRTVEKSKVSLEKAYEALRIVREGDLRRWFDDGMGQMTIRAENRVVLWLRTGDHGARLKEDDEERSVVRRVMDKYFPGGLTPKAVDRAFQPGSLAGYLRAEAGKAFPELNACRNVRLPSGETVASAVRREADRGARLLINALDKKFTKDRLRRLLEKNAALIRLQKKADAVYEREKRIRAALLDAIPEHYRDLYPLARQMRRHFFLHLGPTNSGKTYEGIQRLQAASCGLYLGPLRLLAAEQFEALNLADVPCSLVTGEEQIRVPFSRVQSSTVEMADLQTHYDVAVIDECQMIADRDRGGAWTAAILGLCADEIHACASPDAEGLLTRIINDCGDELTIIRHERMTPLEVEKEGFQFPASVRPGDALIVFSKARVHAVAAELKTRGYKVSLIYGALPPDVRRNQADRFHRGDTEVVVSTDAIAMGMNLPIQRVVFLESEKYDGDITRLLTDSEIKQIAGRAGRYGKYEIGYVNAFGFRQEVARAMARPLLPLTEGVIGFPESLLGIPLPLTGILDQWIRMQDKGCFSKASTVRMAELAAMMETPKTDRRLLYRFICIPFDEKDPDLLFRWKAMYHAECRGEHVDVMPEMPEIVEPESCTIRMLDGLEADYRRCDLYYNYTRLFLPEPDNLLSEIQRRKDLISQGIVHILSTQKLQQRTCPSCKRHLPWNWPYRICDSCYGRGRRW
ncbi:Helicase conserved C-terminal domain-containing protein [Aristaeella hokkaidonensis]|nr:Helicase conserved C-terminal domain-containing protein [Aristaeella hokkaidonensis]